MSVVAAHPPLDSLVRMLYDLRLALVALATIVELSASGAPVATLALLLALPLSYVPLRRWATTGRRLAQAKWWLAVDAVTAAALTVVVTDPQVMLLYSVVTVMVAGLAARLPGAVLVAAVLSMFLVYGLVLTVAGGAATTSDVATGLAFVAVYVLCASGSARLGVFLAEYDLAVKAVSDASRRAASAEERARLAREMHDSLSKTIEGTHLLAIAVAKRVAAVAAGEPGLRGDADRLVVACEIAARDARRLLDGMRSDDAGETCSVSRRVNDVVLEWQTRTGCRVDLDNLRAGRDDLPNGLVYEICCILGEALDNAHRHGKATSVRVGVVERDGWLDVTVADSGTGFVVPADFSTLHRRGHYGLIGMTERAHRAGGRLVVTSEPGAGTRVLLSVPAPRLAPHEAVGAVAS